MHNDPFLLIKHSSALFHSWKYNKSVLLSTSVVSLCSFIFTSFRASFIEIDWLHKITVQYLNIRLVSSIIQPLLVFYLTRYLRNYKLEKLYNPFGNKSAILPKSPNKGAGTNLQRARRSTETFKIQNNTII